MSGGRNLWTGLIAVGGLLLCTFLERRRPLRRSVEPKLRREMRNLVIAGIGVAAVQLLEIPAAYASMSVVEESGWGLLKWLRLPPFAETVLAVVLLDYTLYIWHVLNHRVRLLWRFHAAHHSDLDLDASTALRFHFGEVAFSVPWRVGQVFLIGISPLSYTVWQAALMGSILFHHSNVRLPARTERLLNLLLVTPRMHGIHHSVVPRETNSNWSSGLSLWDRLHGTLLLDVPQDSIAIGVAGHLDPADATLLKTIEMPFTAGLEVPHGTTATA